MAKAEPPKNLNGDKKPEGKEQADSVTPAPAANENLKPAEQTTAPPPANENKKKKPEKPAAKSAAPEAQEAPAIGEEKKEEKPEVKAAQTPAPSKAEQPAEKQEAPKEEAAEKVGATEATAEEVAEAEKKEAEKKKSLKAKVFEKGVDVAGFGDILKAWRSPENRLRNVLKSVGSKAADLIAGRIVSMTFRMIAITWVAGIIGGVSTFGGLALLALATGTASGLYTYSKDYLHDKFYGPKEKRKDVKFFDKTRARSAGIAFLTGSLTGALGAWLAKTGMVQNLFNAFFGAADAGKEAISDVFNSAATKIEEAVAPVTRFTGPALSDSFGAALHPVEGPAAGLAPVKSLVPAPALRAPGL